MNNLHDRAGSIGISIDGVGPEGAWTSFFVDAPFLWATSGVLEDGGLEPFAPDHTSPYDYQITSDFAIVDQLLVDGIGSLPVSAKPFSTDTDWGGYDFQVEAEDFSAEKLLYEPTRAEAELDEDITATETSLTTTATGGGLADTVVWLGDETVKLGTHQGSGVYDGVVRGIYDSTATAHTTDTNLYTSVPEWAERTVRLYTIEPEPDASTKSLNVDQRWIGRIAESISQDQGQIIVPCDQIIAGVAGRGGFEDRDTKPGGLEWAGVGHGGMISIRAQSGEENYKPKILKPNQSAAQYIIGRNFVAHFFAMQAEGQVIPAFAFVNASDEYTGDYKTLSSLDAPIRSGRPFWGNEYGTEVQTFPGNNVIMSGQSPDGETLREVYAVDRARGLSPTGVLRSQFPDYYVYHPVAHWACFNLSTSGAFDAASFDIFSRDWSTGAKSLLGTKIVQDCKDQIEATPNRQIDRVPALGWDGEPVDLWEKCNELFLHAHGFYLGVDDSGNTRLRRVKDVDVEVYDEALNNQIEALPGDILDQSPGRAESVSAIKGTFGATPVNEGKSVFIQAQDGDSVAGAKAGKPGLDLNLATIDPSRSQTYIERLVSRVILQNFAIPRIRIQAEDHKHSSLSYGIGEPVSLEDLPLEPSWFVDKSGERVGTLTDDIEFTGIIQGRQFNPLERNFQLELLLIGDTLIRWRAPSAMITGSSNTGSTLLLDDPDGSSISSFDTTNASSDASYFTAGDDVVVDNQDGTEWGSTSGEIREIDSVSAASNEVTLKNAFSTDPSTASATKILRLAEVDTDDSGTGYTNDGLGTTFTNVARAYLALAESDQTIGDADLDADQYGV